MNPNEKKQGVDINRTTPSTRLGSKDWMKKLEAATGKPMELEGAHNTSGTGVTGNAEKRTVQFRCAETGKPFFVQFTRYSSSHNFQLVSVFKSPEAPSIPLRHYASREVNDQQKSFNASDFDWTGWFCPHCGHKETFVQCAKCHENICGKRVRRLRDETETFTCHDGCGQTGEIKGHIETYSASAEGTPVSNKAPFGAISSLKKVLPIIKRHNLPPKQS